MFDIKQLDNAYDPQEQLLIALGVHPDQKDAQQKVTDALGSGTPKPDSAAATPSSSAPTRVNLRTGQRENQDASGNWQAVGTPDSSMALPPVAPIARPNAARPILLPEQRLAGDQAELDRLKSTGSGISQIKNPFVRTIARIGDVAGRALVPSIERDIPGTEGHHQQLVGQAQGNIANDLGVQSKQAQIAQEQATTKHTQAETDALDNKPSAPPKPFFDQAGDLIGFQSGEELLGPNSPKLTPDMRDMIAATKGKKSAAGTPDAQAMADLVNNGDGTGKKYTPFEAFQKIQAGKTEGKLDSVDQQELADFIKNPPKGYTGTPTQYAKWKASLAPQAQVVVSNAAANGMNDQALDNAAEKYWAQGALPAGGRGPAVMAQNQKIMNRAAELHPGESIVAGTAAFKANEASLKHLQQNFDQVTAFENTAGKNLEVFLGTAKNAIDSGQPWINQPLRSLTGKLGGTDQIAFDTARTTALTEIAKVLNSSNAAGVLSDSARHEVEGLIGKDATLTQIYSAANILKQDMANRHQAYADQIKDIQGRMPNKNTSSGSANTKKDQHPEEKKYPGFVVDQ